MTILISCLLAGAWLIAIPTIVWDALDWQARPDNRLQRNMRGIMILTLVMALSLFAFWTVAAPYL